MLAFISLLSLLRNLMFLSMSFVSVALTDGAVMSSHIKVIDNSKELQQIKSSNSLTLVYYSIKDRTDDNQKITKFLDAYEKSAKYLEEQHFSIILAVFECTSSSSETECSVSNVEDNIYTYMNNTELITLDLDTMFDINSIVANSLQLALLEEVPILSSLEELRDLEQQLVGQRDLLVAYLGAIGTEENRIFIEIAYRYHKKFKFALSTDYTTVAGLEDSGDIKDGYIMDSSVVVWLLSCKEATLEIFEDHNGCYNVKYPLDVTEESLSSYIQKISNKTLIHASKENLAELLDSQAEVPIVYIYKDTLSEDKASSLIEFFSHHMRGVGQVIVVDMHDEYMSNYVIAIFGKRKLPTLSLKRAVQSHSGARESTVPAMLFYDQDLNLDHVKLWVSDQIFSHSEDITPAEELDQLIRDVETQDDEVANAVFATKQDFGDQVTSLDARRFPTAVASSTAAIMVIFYLTFDAVSLAALREFDHAAQLLETHMPQKGLLGRVNCFDASDVCLAENITTYPTVKIYRESRSLQEYTGLLHHESIASAVKLIQTYGPIQLTSASDVTKFVKGHDLDYFQISVPTSVLLVLDEEMNNTEALQTFTKVSQALSTISPFAYVSSKHTIDLIKHDVSLPTIVAWNRHDDFQRMHTFTSVLNEESLVNFVKKSNIGSMPEVTIHNFPDLIKMSKVLTLLFIDPEDLKSPLIKQKFNDIALKGKHNTNLFCWMNGVQPSPGHTVLTQWASSGPPVLAVVDYTMSQVFIKNINEHASENMEAWLDQVFQGDVTPTKELNHKSWGPPNRHYDFLQFMDWEESNTDYDTNYNDHSKPDDNIEDEMHSAESMFGSEEMRNSKHQHTEL